MPIGSTNVYNAGDLILSTVSGSGASFTETKIIAATSSLILFNSSATLTSQSLNSTTVGTSSYVSGSTSIITNLTASNISASNRIQANQITASSILASNGPLMVTGSNAYIQIFPVGGFPLPTNLTASYIYTSGSTNDLYFTQYNGPYTNTTRLRWLESNLYTGILHGGVLTSTPGSTTFTVTEGEGLIVSLNAFTASAPYPTVKLIQWPTSTQPIINSGSAKITYVGIDNVGAIVQQTNAWGSSDINQWDNQIELGVVLHLSGSVSTGVFNSPQISYGIPQQTDDFLRAFGPLKISGHTLQASGSTPTLSIKKSGGTAYRDGANYVNNPNHPSTVVENAITSSKIYRYYISGSTPIIDTGVGNAGYTTIDNDNYVNTATGQLATVGNSNWTIQRVFWIPNSPTNAFIVYYGNATYSTLLNAVNAKDSEPFTESPNTSLNAIFVGYIIIEGGAGRDLLNALECTIIQGGLFRNVGGIGSSGTSPVSTTLAGLSDVALAGLAEGDLLVYGGGQWSNKKTLIGNYTVSGSLSVTSGITGNLTGTSSWATNAVTSSFALTASYVSGSTSIITNLTASNISASGTITANSFTGSFSGSITNAVTAISASFSTNSLTASYLTPANSYTITNLTASNISASATGSFGIVGIGTSSPTGSLHVNNSVANIPILNLGGGVSVNNVSDLYVLNSYNTASGVGFAAKVIGVNISDSLTSGNIPVQRTVWSGVNSATAIVLSADDPGGGTDDNAFQIWTSNQGTSGSALTQKFTLTTDGNVGIGTTSPRSGLQVNTVNGAAANEYAGLIVSSNLSSSRGVNIAYDATNDAGIITAVHAGTGWKPLALQPVNGNVGIGTTNPTSRLHVSSSTGGVFEVDTAGGATTFYVSASGNVGIGTITPNGKLHIVSPDSTYAFSVAGATKGVRFNINSAGTYIQGVDNTLAGSYQSLILGGSDLYFQTNGLTTAMYISSSGNVGIGTTAPAYKLTVQNDAASTNALLGLQNFSTSATTNHGVSILPILSDNTGSTAITAGGLYWLKEQQWTNDTTSRDSYLRIDTTENGLASEKVRITSAGNVGIGTTNPNSARLHLYGPASFGATIRLTNTGTTGGDYFITSTDAGWNAGGNKLLIGNGTPASPNAKLILDSNGNVGIGVASPSGRLHITGSSTNGENLVYLSKGSGSIAQHYITAVNQNGVLNYRVTSDINGHAQQILYLAGTIHVYHDSYWSSYINNANYTQGGLALGTGSLTHGYGLTIARPSTSGSLYVSGSSIFTGSVNVNGSVTFSGPIIYDNAVLLDYGSASTPVVSTNYAVLQNLTGSYNSAFFDYFASSGSNFRAGTVIAGWSGSSINYTEYSTTDVGNTNELSMSVDLSGSFVRLLTRVSTTINWNIKSAGRYL